MFCSFSYQIAQTQDLHLQFLRYLGDWGKKHNVLFEDCSQAQSVYTWKCDAYFISEIDGFCESCSK